MRFIGLRHGQSTYNLQHLCNDDALRPVWLTEVGKEQARRAAGLLLDENIGSIFCSPLPRAVQTAAWLNQHLQCRLFIEPDLADIRSGYESRPVSDYQSALGTDPINAAVNGGESLAAYYQRVSGFLQRLRAKGENDVLLVAHEETLRMFQAWCDNSPLSEVFNRPFENCLPYVFSSR